jgi:hypothetical protein
VHISYTLIRAQSRRLKCINGTPDSLSLATGIHIKGSEFQATFVTSLNRKMPRVRNSFHIEQGFIGTR